MKPTCLFRAGGKAPTLRSAATLHVAGTIDSSSIARDHVHARCRTCLATTSIRDQMYSPTARYVW